MFRKIGNTNKPNPATWVIWAWLAIQNSWSYFAMGHDWAKSFIAMVSSVLCIATFLFALFAGKFSKLDRWEIVIVLMCLMTMIVWKVYGSATVGNMLTQIVFIVSFIPTYQTVGNNGGQEHGLPWLLWAGAYLVSLTAVCANWTNVWYQIVYPINAMLLHGGVAIYATYLRKYGAVVVRH
ncbi:MAG: hypothetical protein ACKKL5_03415 [Candidatus Komeilibacteria bacterium]